VVQTSKAKKSSFTRVLDSTGERQVGGAFWNLPTRRLHQSQAFSIPCCGSQCSTTCACPPVSVTVCGFWACGCQLGVHARIRLGKRAYQESSWHLVGPGLEKMRPNPLFELPGGPSGQPPRVPTCEVPRGINAWRCGRAAPLRQDACCDVAAVHAPATRGGRHPTHRTATSDVLPAGPGLVIAALGAGVAS
jgi:hypothetical protein